ncbi:tRNA 5-methylaminomethyl-2-thiouridine biosynthesis bifunctional protein MnmC [Neolewinella maritima]|uniref:tRNA 5-methylaminomethyl-2-thiouridine biosynthesis bifunctional protein MnmC n=1 Tax=Neolewinella maritima TaxID=1383882 RepID=A0ABN8F712_9BACT|nr:tRNA (5-methylaminomethyl-2-thiouridine)(34)-methyltransferase MnmD [Neolewinella maritima]CAH0999732.1 tRNA 5-methylaminomethyl-2-thiouridine biosynthesis bifunctional protein MnmC [Neolewinella maritima]
MNSPEPFVTEDGSHSLRSLRFGVNYHSTHGALQESRHIFIDAGLRPLLAGAPAQVRIVEMGFGSGLNALLLRQLAEEMPDTRFTYTTYEQYPITPEQASRLNYPDLLECPQAWLADLHAADWDVPVDLTANLSFRKVAGDFLALAEPDGIAGDLADVIFYDAFAPENQPELWTVAAMQRCHALLRTGGRLVTYCAKGQFKRNLRQVGFRVEALPGPVGKREITRAVRS